MTHSRNFDDLKDQRFGELTAVEFEGRGSARIALWKCRCVCGAEVIVRADKLKQARKTRCSRRCTGPV